MAKGPTQPKHVRAAIQNFSANLFGAHVLQRAADRAIAFFQTFGNRFRSVDAVIIEHSCRAPIHDMHLTKTSNHVVEGL